MDGIENFDDGGMTFHQSPVDKDFKDEGSDEDIKIYERKRGVGKASLNEVKKDSDEHEDANDKEPGVKSRILGWLANKLSINRGPKNWPDSVAARRLNKAKLLEKPDKNRVCEDEILVDERNQIFAVFDGVGGVRGAAKAARMAAMGLAKAIYKKLPESARDLADIVLDISKKMEKEKVGMTTAVIGRIMEDEDGKRLEYVSVGDSRIYRIRGKEIIRVTGKDEGEGSFISNALGLKGMTVKKRGFIELQDGDCLIFCTDGITGDGKKLDDGKTDEFPEERLVEIVQSAKSADEAAEIILRESLKEDDRALVVVGIKKEK